MPNLDIASPDRTDAQTADTLNSLLRGELSAVETYDQAVGKFGDHPVAIDKLRLIRDEHAESVRILRELVLRYSGTPSEGSGPWGAFVSAVTGTAKVIGPATVLSTLQQGEEVGIADYRRALDSGVPPECRDVILNDLLPRCEEHIAYLDDLHNVVS
jgi:hypothetical protein